MIRAARILCIEDEPDLREDLVLELTEAGYEVQSAGDGATGLVALTEYRPDLVICDIQLPRRSGLELLREVTKPGGRRPGFLFLSAYSDRESRQQAADLGASHFLVKPVDYARLLELVGQILRDEDGG